MDRELRVVLSARVFSDQKCFGPGVSQLLKRVDELHSLRAAALSMSMAYSKAWKTLRQAGEDGRPQGPPLRRGWRIAAAGR